MGERGSILIEALVATAIVAMILGAVYRVTGDGAARRGGADHRRLAVLAARSQLAALGTTVPLDRASSGIDGAIAWSVSFEPWAVPAGRAGTPTLVTIVAAPRDAPRDRVVLRTVRLRPAA